MQAHLTRKSFTKSSAEGRATLEIDVQIESRIEAINPAVRKLIRLLKRVSCIVNQEYEVELALREALANAIVHGNKLDPEKRVHLCCSCDLRRGVILIVKDEGEGFDPADVPDPESADNIESDHGRGLHLIRRVMDEVHFSDDGREIQMQKSQPFRH